MCFNIQEFGELEEEGGNVFLFDFFWFDLYLGGLTPSATLFLESQSILLHNHIPIIKPKSFH
jgi:hypothetical protein